MGGFPCPAFFFKDSLWLLWWIFLDILDFFLITEAIFSTTDTLGGHALNTHFRNVYRASVQNRNGVYLLVVCLPAP